MKVWREIAFPYADVLKGTFHQAEFSADITAVHTGKASHEHQDAAAIFEGTCITDGMRLLFTEHVHRLSVNGRVGGERDIQLQTAFGGERAESQRRQPASSTVRR